MTSDDPKFDLFISYAHTDNKDGWISRFVEEIQRTYKEISLQNLTIFFDKTSIKYMDDWEFRILKGIQDSKVMLAFVSENYFSSPFCRREWLEFSQREKAKGLHNEGIAIIYYVTVPGYPDIEENRTDEWVRNLSRRQYWDLRSWRERGLNSLVEENLRNRIKALEQQIHLRIKKAEKADLSPTNIPPHNPRFVGRLDQLRDLRKSLALGLTSVLTAVHGVGGVGKSALAFEYAHAYADSYPGGRYLLQAENAKDLGALLKGLRYELELTLTREEMNDDTLAAKRVIKELSSRGRCLLLLDNIDQHELVSPNVLNRLVPDRDLLHLLVTTRINRELLTDTHCIELSSLADEEALTLLANFQPFKNERERSAAIQIVDFVGAHTLTCELIGVYLSKRYDLSYSSFARWLKVEGVKALQAVGHDPRVSLSRHPEKLVSALFDTTFSTLGEIERATLEIAAVLHPDYIALPWIFQVLSSEYPEINRRREPWEEDPWLTVMRGLTGTRVFLPQYLVGERVVLARLHRILSHVLRQRQERNLLERRREQLMELAFERVKLFASGQFSTSDMWEVSALAEFSRNLVSEGSAYSLVLVCHVCPILNLTGDRALAGELLELGLGRCADDSSNLIKGKLLTQLGITQFSNNSFSSSSESLKEALSCLERSDKAENEFHLSYSECLNWNGIIARRKGKLKEARILHEQAFGEASSFSPADWFEKFLAGRLQAHALANIGAYHLRLKEYPAVYEKWKKALEISISIDDRAWVAHFKIDVGFALLLIGDADGALEVFDSALEISRGMNLRESIVRVLMKKGSANLLRGDLAEANRFYDESLVKMDEWGIKRIKWKVLHNIGTTCALSHEPNRAAKFYKAAIEEILATGRGLDAGGGLLGFLSQRRNVFQSYVVFGFREGASDVLKYVGRNPDPEVMDFYNSLKHRPDSWGEWLDKKEASNPEYVQGYYIDI